MAADHTASAMFSYDKGYVRIPEGGSSDFALRLRIVRYDAHVEPVVLLEKPGEGYHRLRPTSDDGVTLRYDDQSLPTSGGYALLLTSSKSIGHIDLHLLLSEAEVLSVTSFHPDWAPLFGGVGLGTLMLGAYTPGAALLREMRRLTGR